MKSKNILGNITGYEETLSVPITEGLSETLQTMKDRCKEHPELVEHYLFFLHQHVYLNEVLKDRLETLGKAKRLQPAIDMYESLADLSDKIEEMRREIAYDAAGMIDELDEE